MPRQILVGENGEWILTAEKRDCLYFMNNASPAKIINWRQSQEEYLIALAERDGMLYLCVGSGKEIQVRKQSGKEQWTTLVTVASDFIGDVRSIDGFWVDRNENIYLVNKNEVLFWNVEDAKTWSFTCTGNHIFG